MNNLTALFILLFFNSISSFAQDRTITCSSENNQDNSISIFADSRFHADYTVKLIFNSLMGYTSNWSMTSDIALLTVSYGKKEILKLTQVKSQMNYSSQFHYQYFPGIALRKAPDSSFVYLLPTNADNHLGISKVFSLSERLGLKKTVDFYGTAFIFKRYDTICASRSGSIYECNDKVKVGENTESIYKSDRNKIAIEHKDGSLGNYEVLAPIHLLVSPGDYVYSGQPLAVFEKESANYMVIFSIFYLDEKKLIADRSNGFTESPSYFVYTPAHFYSCENNGSISLQANKEYKVQHPLGVITAEMSKKEKRKLGYK